MRVVVWFSCGAASAVAAKLATEQLSDVDVVYCDTLAFESVDNPRFMRDVEQWIGQPITIIKSTRYTDVDDVFRKTRYMSGIAGARCTVEMKKVPRFDYQRPDDLHVFGYTVDEQHRVDHFVANNPELKCWWPLINAGLTKGDCLARLDNAGIELPLLYRQGFKNNNCIGCVKASSFEYWANVRFHYPVRFDELAALSRELGVRLVRWQGERVFLDELPEIDLQPTIFENVSCGPECGLVTTP